MKLFEQISGLALGAVVFFAGASAMAQADRPIYTDNEVNNFSDSAHNLTRNVANTSPVHTGSYSISATVTNSGGYLYLNHAAFDSSPYASISFWINGGAAGGQLLKVYGLLNGTTQTAYALPQLMTNTWQQFIVPLSSLGCSNKSNFTGFRIQDASNGAQPVFYMDDVYLGVAPAPAVVHLNILANQTNRLADARWFGVNTATWDGNLGNPATIPALKAAGILTLRWPGGSGADVHDWTTDISTEKTFNNVATNLGANAQTFITVNYGSGTSNLASGWVLFANVTNHCNFQYWEIGNECYGTWETDYNTNNGYYPWDPYTYAVRAATYMAAMRAADPTIKIGVVATPGDDSDSNGYTSHPAYNARTGQYHNGWVPVMLATLKSLGVQPDFLIHHVYPQITSEPLPASPPPPRCVDSDMFILQATGNWAGDAATLRQEISDYFGPAGTNIELCCTENNSDSSLGGKQLSSLVNGLYEADSLAHLMQTEFNSYLWWDFRNGTGTSGELDASLYGWRQYGDEGLITGATGYNPVYYAMKMMQYFARPGDAVINASSDYLLLSTYATRQTNGTLTVLVVNKDPVANFNGQFNFIGFSPDSNAVIRTYGESQDNATEFGQSAALQDIATTSINSASNLFTYSFPPYSLTTLTFVPSAAGQLNIQPLGANLQLTWQQGTLLAATNVNGPWVPDYDPSPLTVYPTNAQMFYKVAILANPVSINFAGSGTLMAGSESAGVVPETNWNNAVGSSGSAALLSDATGNLNGATFTWSANGVFSTGISDTAGNSRMMKNYLDTGNATTTTVTVNGLPANANGWNVYVYFDGSNPETREGAYTISGTGITTTSINGFDLANTDFSGTFAQASSSAGNYVQFSIPNVSGFTLNATPVANGATTPRAPVNGIQIVPQ